LVFKILSFIFVFIDRHTTTKKEKKQEVYKNKGTKSSKKSGTIPDAQAFTAEKGRWRCILNNGELILRFRFSGRFSCSARGTLLYYILATKKRQMSV